VTPFATARAWPSPVRVRISSRSNAASLPSTIKIKRPCAVEVSAHAVAKGAERCAPGGYRCKGVEQVACGSREPVEARRDQHVAGVEHFQGAAKLQAVGLRSARRLAKNLLGSGRA
jgi:hypothetical protein